MNKYLHKRSNAVVGNNHKEPTISDIEIGEIALNYKDGKEALFIKNDNNEIVTFSPDDIILAQAGGGGGGASIEGLFSSVTYDSIAKKIYFYDNNGSQVGEINATDFIKDGMISSVTVSSGNLVLSFNTDAGREDITLSLSQIFDPDNYYTKTQADNKFPTIAEASEYAAAALANARAYADSLSGNYATKASFTAHTADTNVHVTTAQTNTWNGKQDAISDLSTIRNNASSGATAYSTVNTHTADTTIHVTSSEKSTWNEKQNAINDLSTIRNNASSGATAYTTITGHTADTTIHFTTGDVKSQIEAYGYTTNVGTITGIKMNGASKGSSGVVDLGTVITGETQLSTGTTGTQTGNAITSISVDGHQVKITKETTFALSSNTHNAITGVNATLTAHTADTNVHVTTAQTNTWDGKQDAISDLQTIRNNASSGATAYTNMVTGVTAGGTNLTKTNKVVAIPSASSSTFGVIKVGNFLSNSNGSISVSTGTSNSTVARGDHSHSNYASNANFTAHTADTTVHFTTGDVKSQIEAYGYLTGYTETDPTVPAWAKNSTKPSYTLDEVSDGTTRKLSNYATSAATHTAIEDLREEMVDNEYVNALALTDLNTKISNLSGSVITISGQTSPTGQFLPTVTSSDNGKILQVVNGVWTLVSPVNIYYGSSTPSDSMGNNGDIYIQQ